MTDLYDELCRFCETEKDKSLATMTTLHIGGKARYVVYPTSTVALDEIIRCLQLNGVEYKVFGKGSDILCSDDDYDGVIIRLDRYFHENIYNDNEIVAQAGSSLIELSVEAMKHSLSGLEFATGIPGTVGGSIYMNAGAYRASISDVIKEVFVYREGKMEWMAKEECGFGYRTSVFQAHDDWIILAGRFVLEHGEREEIAELMADRRKRRMASQPLDKPSCGSVFRNPDGVNAWELIEGIGYRGRRLGDARVSEKHCNFIVNEGNATARDYYQLTQEIIAKVKEKYGIELKKEMELFNWK